TPCRQTADSRCDSVPGALLLLFPAAPLYDRPAPGSPRPQFCHRWASWAAPATPGMAMNLKLHATEPLKVPADRLAYARQIVRAEAAALEQVAGRLDGTFLEAVELMRRCAGRVAVTGTGKSADIGQKIAGTLNSTGTRAYILDATRAVHGDLGMVHPNDVVLALSHSGESEEVVRLLGPLKQLAHALVALTGNGQSTLARQAAVSFA